MATILFVGGGRRVELARAFARKNCRVLAYEGAKECPLYDEVPVFVGLPWAHPDFPADVARLVRVQGVDLVVPLMCEAAARLAESPPGCPVAGGYPGSDDKRRLEAVAAAEFPDLYPSPVLGQPAVYKPRFGFGGRGVVYSDYHGETDGFVAQARLTGPEFSVDAYFAKGGELVVASPRTRDRVAGGEVLDSTTVDRPDLVGATRRVGKALGMRGPACLQFMGAGEARLTEVNARFGGGVTLTLAAGCDLVRLALEDFLLPADMGPPTEWAPPAGYRLTRSYRDHVVEPDRPRF